jgi:RNA polymerase sigma-70 factor (ECF subfamily)
VQRGQSTLPTPEQSVIDSQQRAQLESFMERMRPQYRRLIDLRFFRDFSYEELAAELGIPIGTVKTQLHRAREQMCKFIDDGKD